MQNNQEKEKTGGILWRLKKAGAPVTSTYGDEVYKGSLVFDVVKDAPLVMKVSLWERVTKTGETYFSASIETIEYRQEPNLVVSTTTFGQDRWFPLDNPKTPNDKLWGTDKFIFALKKPDDKFTWYKNTNLKSEKSPVYSGYFPLNYEQIKGMVGEQLALVCYANLNVSPNGKTYMDFKPYKIIYMNDHKRMMAMEVYEKDVPAIVNLSDQHNYNPNVFIPELKPQNPNNKWSGNTSANTQKPAPAPAQQSQPQVAIPTKEDDLPF